MTWLALALAAGCMPDRRGPASADVGSSTDDGSADAGATADGAAAADSDGYADSAAADTAADTAPIPTGCSDDAMCAKLVSGVCRVVTCNLTTGLCEVKLDIDGTPCGKPDPCVIDPTCQQGVCQGDAKACDDGKECTKDDCVPGTGCTHLPSNEACDDGNPCTEGDVCAVTGGCAGKPKLCPGAKPPCLLAKCDASVGCTVVSAELAAGATVTCDDANPCTDNTACAQGVCAGTAKICKDDGNPCTWEACVPLLGGCSTQPADMPAVCDDGDACTIQSVCQGTACTGIAKSCDDANACTTDGCDPAGGCKNVASTAGVECDDASVCTSLDSCKDGGCAGKPVDCDDGNTCSDDACHPQVGCQHKGNLSACSDGDPCTTSDVCEGLACKAQPVVCDDQNACTKDECGTSGCAHTPLSNGTTCGGAGQCWASACVVAKCGNGSCEFNESTASCVDDCPEGGGVCESADAPCIVSCTTGKCGAESAACAGDSACAKLDSCVSACNGEDCRHACVNAAAPSVVAVWRTKASCVSAKCIKNGWSGKNCKANQPAFVACVDACEAALCVAELASCMGATGCAGIAKCVDLCTDGNAACVKDCFAKGSGADVDAFDVLTVCMNLKCL